MFIKDESFSNMRGCLSFATTVVYLFIMTVNAKNLKKVASRQRRMISNMVLGFVLKLQNLDRRTALANPKQERKTMMKYMYLWKIKVRMNLINPVTN